MKKSAFLVLADKYLKGTLTPEEEQVFLDACSSLEQGVPEWDEQLLGAQHIVRDRLYGNIISKVSESQFKPKKRNILLKIAAVFTGMIILMGVLYHDTIYNQLFPVKTLLVETDKKEMKKIILPDGTKVWLNKQGSISYPATFRDSVRMISLTGEAYFDVARNTKPFIIQTARLNTRVLGTSFVVKSYPGDHQSKVAVITGKVSVQQTTGTDNVILLPGQEATASGHGDKLAVRNHVDSLIVKAWMNNKLSFRQSPLSEVIDDLERHYDISIQVDEHLLQCLIYVDVEPGDKPMFILEQLAVSLNGKVYQTGPSAYKLKGKGCDN